MLPGFEAEKSLTGDKALYASGFVHTSSEDNIIPLVRTCRPCGLCVEGRQTCWRYIFGDDACEPYEKSCGGGGEGTNCCGKRSGSPCP